MIYPYNVYVITYTIALWSVTFFLIATVVAMQVDFGCALSYALQRLGTPDMKLKAEQIASISAVYNGKAGGWALTVSGETLVSPLLSLARFKGPLAKPNAL